MSRWHIPTGFLTLTALAALTLLSGCPEDPAEAMLKARASAPPAAPPATAPPSTPAAGAPGTPAVGAPGTPPPGAPAGKPGERGLLPPGTPAAEPAKDAGPKITIDVKEIKAPYPRYSGKGRYNLTLDVSIDPPQDDGVWKFTALDAAGKVVGTQEEQLVLLREKPRTVILNSFYCTSAPTSVKMTVALDKEGKPKVAKAAGSGVGDQPGGSGGNTPPGGAGNPPPGDGGRGAGGGGGAPPGGGAAPPGGGGGAAPPGGGAAPPGGGGESGGGEGG